MKFDPGKEAEKRVNEILQNMSNLDVRFAFHRLPDARAARGALAAQPSDFLVINNGVVHFVEVKECAEINRLPKAKISQWGSLYKMWLASAKVDVIVFRSAFQDWVIFHGDVLFPFPMIETPTSFPWTKAASKHFDLRTLLKLNFEQDVK